MLTTMKSQKEEPAMLFALHMYSLPTVIPVSKRIKGFEGLKQDKKAIEGYFNIAVKTLKREQNGQ